MAGLAPQHELALMQSKGPGFICLLLTWLLSATSGAAAGPGSHAHSPSFERLGALNTTEAIAAQELPFPSRTLLLTGRVPDKMAPYPDGRAGDQVAAAVAIDGNALLVGAPGDTVGSTEAVGSAYLYTRTGADWILKAKVSPRDGSSYSRYGHAVALSGDLMAVGGPSARCEGGANCGRVAVFEYIDGEWTQTAHLGDGIADSGALFGHAVAVARDHIVIGAPGATGGGAAYEFRKIANQWQLARSFGSPNGNPSDEFGFAVAIGAEIAVGAPRHDPNGLPDKGSTYLFPLNAEESGFRQLVSPSPSLGGYMGYALAMEDDLIASGSPLGAGAVHIFRRGASDWSHVQTLTLEGASQSSFFGTALDFHRETLIVGAYLQVVFLSGENAAYTFRRNDGGWTLDAVLRSSDGARNERVGSAVALGDHGAALGASLRDVDGRSDQGAVLIFEGSASGAMAQTGLLTTGRGGGNADFLFSAVRGNLAVVSSPSAQADVGDSSGETRIYRKNQGSWALEAVVHPSGSTGPSTFVRAHAISESGDVFVGDPGAITPTTESRGAVYVFRKVDGSWIQVARITSSTPDSWNFGASLAVDGSVLAIGQPRAIADGAMQSGRVSVFTINGGSWEETGEITAPLEPQNDDFGHAVAMAGGFLLVGAPNRTVDGQAKSGTVYAFALDGDDWTLTSTLVQTPPQANNNFGQAIAMNAQHAAISAPGPGAFGSGRRGAVEIFGKEGANWNALQTITPPQDHPAENFGRLVALDKLLVVGATSASQSVLVYELDDGTSPKGWSLVASMASIGRDPVAPTTVSTVDDELFVGDILATSAGVFGQREGATHILRLLPEGAVFFSGFE